MMEASTSTSTSVSVSSYGLPFSTVCRTCLRVSQDMRSLSDSETARMLMECVSLQIIHGDGMPGLICHQCFKQMNKSYDFKKLCEKSDDTLKRFILRGFLPSEFSPAESDECDGGFIASEMILERVPGERTPFTRVHNLESISGSRSDDEDTSGFTDCPEVGLEPECNLMENALAALEENIKKDTLEMDDNSWLQQTIKIINQDTEVQPETFIKPKSITWSVMSQGEQSSIISLFDEFEDSFQCSVENCTEKFKSLDDLSAHLSSHWSGDTLECDICNRKFTEVDLLRKHVAAHVSWKAHKCKVCSREFTDANILKRHAQKHEENKKNNKFTCTVCGQGYKDSFDLSVHMRKHTGEKPHECKFCDKKFSNQNLLHSHIKTHKKEKVHQCPQCDKSFIHKSTLHTHKRTHTGEQPYGCTFCDKKFAQSSNLSIHMRTHTGEKPYVCSICNRGFSTSTKLTAHIRLHTGEKPFPCEVCGKYFARSEDVVIHMRSHTSERPYSCSMCDRKFTTASHKNRHELTHAKPHPCKTCGDSFTSILSLKRHSEVHKNEEDISGNEQMNFIIKLI